MSPIEVEEALAAESPGEVEKVAQAYARSSLANLVREILHGESESAKVTACNEVLDRGWGKPAVEAPGDPMLPFAPAPGPSLTLHGEIRDEARRYTRLSIQTLERISAAGQIAQARVAASRSLLNRSIGTVAAARLPDQAAQAPLGKKEAQAIAARTASSGIYATPPGPETQH